ARSRRSTSWPPGTSTRASATPPGLQTSRSSRGSRAACSRRARGRPSSGPQLLDPALFGGLVGTPAQELCAVADPPARDVVEGDLADELGPQPLPHELLVGLPPARLTGPALVGPVGLEQLEQLALLLRGESRGVPDDAQLAAVVVQPQDQRSDGVGLLAEPERRDNHVRGPHALDLSHPGPLARLVGRLALLGDDSLGLPRQPGSRRLPVWGHRRQLHAVAVDHLLEPRPALVEGKLVQHVVALREQGEATNDAGVFSASILTRD